MTSTETLEALTCSFCGKNKSEVARLIAGPGVYICDQCVNLCIQIIEQSPGDPKGGGHQSTMPPTIKAWEGLSDDDLLAEMVRAHAAHQSVDRAVALHVAVLRERGVSWARIGEALGMARQSAWERFSGEE